MKMRSIALALCLVLVFVCAGCSGGNSTAADGEEVYTLSLTMHDPATTGVGLLYQAWADEINGLTDGHVRVELYGSGTLAAGTDAVDYVKSGAADIGWVYTAFFSGQFPLSEVVSIPLLGLKDPVQTTNVLWDLYDETEALQEELSGFKVLMLYGNPMNFISSNSPIETVDDLRGMNLRCPTGGVSEVLQAWGANPILMNSNEIYEGLEKGYIQGTVHEWNGLNTFSLAEQLTYYMDMPLYDGVFVLAMNWDSWNALPEEYQQAIERVSLKDGSLSFAEDFNGLAMEAKESILANGGTLVTPTDEALAEFQVAADEYMDSWAESVTGDSFDGEAYLARTLELVTQYGD